MPKGFFRGQTLGCLYLTLLGNCYDLASLQVKVTKWSVKKYLGVSVMFLLRHVCSYGLFCGVLVVDKICGQ